VVGISTGCASSQTKAYRAQEKVHSQRLQLIENYKKCLEKAGEDQVKVEKCDRYLKASEALK
jgi:hypothetical protein